MNLPNQLARPNKLNHAQTILYEIDMLIFAAAGTQAQSRWSAWANLECFLLHFRNLIEFFGKPPLRDDDLSIRKPDLIWTDASTKPEPQTLSHLWREDLWRKYEVPQNNEKISRYLLHCTEQRLVDKSWNVREMFEELAPSLTEFEKLLPNPTRPWGNLPNKETISLPPYGNVGTAS